MRPPSQTAARTAWRDGAVSQGPRDIPEETPVALTYDGSTYAVMMATPADLEDFAVGFSLTEAVIERADQILDLEIVDSDLGIEARMWLAGDRSARLADHRRRVVGPTGCGLCGVESLEQAARPHAPVGGEDLRIVPAALIAAMNSLEPGQTLGRATRAVHAAAFWRPDAGLVALREDVGRHNALDKLIGALARSGLDGQGGVVLLTSRLSVEMIQKTAVLGAPVVVAVSAPTALAVRAAEASGITLVAVARRDGFEVFTCPERIAFDAETQP